MLSLPRQHLAAAPLEAWPDTPTSYLLCRDDRMFPGAWARRHARERLDIDLDEMDGDHYVALSRLRELAHGWRRTPPALEDPYEGGLSRRP